MSYLAELEKIDRQAWRRQAEGRPIEYWAFALSAKEPAADQELAAISGFERATGQRPRRVILREGTPAPNQTLMGQALKIERRPFVPAKCWYFEKEPAGRSE